MNYFNFILVYVFDRNSRTYISCSKHSRIDEMNQAVIFCEVILNGCARQQHSSFRFQAHERIVCLIFAVFQSMSFIAQQQTNFRFIQNGRIISERFIADDQNWTTGSNTLTGHKLFQTTCCFFFRLIFDGKYIHPMT